MDIASLIGILTGLVMVIFGIVFDSKAGIVIGNLQAFIDIPSFIITIGGSLGSLMASNTMKDFISGFKSFPLIFKGVAGSAEETIGNIIELSNVARKEGLLALEEAGNNIEDPFLKKGIMLVVDGTDPELVRGILETDLMGIDGRHSKVAGFWSTWGALGPAWGMIGTLIGLINMLGSLDDVSTIGPSMAVALVTTLYGSLIANWICAPVENKLKANNEIEMMLKEITVEGLLSIQAGENPRVIEEKLKSFLSPADREGIGTDGGSGGGEA